MFNYEVVTFYYVHTNEMEYIFEDFEKAENFAEENDSYVSDMWGNPLD